MPRKIQSDEAIDTSVKWDRASEILQGRDSANVAMPNDSPVSPDVEKSRWSELPSKLPESDPSNSTKDEDTSSAPVHPTDTGDLNFQSRPDSAIVATSSQPPPAFPIPKMPPTPPIHSFSMAPPSFQSYGSPYRVPASRWTSAPTPAYSSIPIPPVGGNSTRTASAPVGSQFFGYRPLYGAASPYSPASGSMTYPGQEPRPPFQYSSPYLQQTPLFTASPYIPSPNPTGYKPRLPGTPHEISRPGRRKDAYVAHDPFRSCNSNQAVEKCPAISSDTTFDDIPTAGSPRAPTSSASTPFGTANSYDLSNHFLSSPPQVSGPPRPNTASSQYATPLSQPTGSYQSQYPDTQPNASSAAQQTAPLRPLPPLPDDNRPQLPRRNHEIPVHPAHPNYLLSPGQEAGLTIPQGAFGPPFSHIHYPNLPEPQSSPPGRHSVSYYTPYNPPNLEQSYPVLPAVPSQLNAFSWQSPQINPYVPEYVNLATDDPNLKEKPEGPGTAANRNIFVTLPKMFYLYLLLRLPSLYFGRVTRIFEEADLSLPEIKQMVLETAGDFHVMENNTLPPQYERLKVTWQSFIDDVMREWQTFNLISVLLLSAILSILSNNASANDLVLKYSALSSLICALLSLLFGCTYIIRFGSMRKTYKAAEWALEAKKTKTFIFWNVWVLLAMPVALLVQSHSLHLLIWTFTVRLVLTFLLVLGVNYGILILATFSRYGEAMDKAWKRRIDGWLEEQAALAPVPPSYPPAFVNHSPGSYSAPPYSDPRQGQFVPPHITPPPTMSPLRPPPDPDFDRTSDLSLPSYMSDMDAGYGYTSDQKRLNAYYTLLNTMLNKSAHLEPDDTTTNLIHKSPPTGNSESTPPHDAPSITSRLVAPKSIRVPPLNPNSWEDLSPREHEGNQNQDSPHVRFRSPLTSAVEPPMTDFNPEDLYNGR